MAPTPWRHLYALDSEEYVLYSEEYALDSEEYALDSEEYALYSEEYAPRSWLAGALRPVECGPLFPENHLSGLPPPP
jgi:hypothetical protein